MTEQRKSRRYRRPRGQGSMRLRGRIYWMELNWKGQRFQKSLETTNPDEAALRLDAEIAAIRSGSLPKSYEPITVQEMYDAWILTPQTNCKPRTVEDYRSRWDKHLKPVFGKQLATQVTKDSIAGYLWTRKRNGAGICTRNRERGLLQQIFNYNREKIPPDRFPVFPAKLSERALVRKGRLSDKDYKIVCDRLENPKLFWLKVFLTMTFKYGFRKNELLSATVDYFDPEKATFTLPSYTTKNSQERVVQLVRDGEIYKMLKTLIKDRPAQARIFTRRGRPVKDFRGEWAKQTEGIKGGSGKGGAVTIHDLRRSAITRMAARGITAQQAGTHLTTDTFNRYIVMSDAEKQKIAEAIEGD